MIEAAAFVLWAILFVGAGKWWDRYVYKPRDQAHQTLGSRIVAWLIRRGILADDATSKRMSDVDDDFRRRGY